MVREGEMRVKGHAWIALGSIGRSGVKLRDEELADILCECGMVRHFPDLFHQGRQILS